MENRELPVEIKDVGAFDTKCIARVFGKNVNGYLVSYFEEKTNGCKVHYERQLAVIYQLKDGRLTDFGWCHSFLYKEENILSFSN